MQSRMERLGWHSYESILEGLVENPKKPIKYTYVDNATGETSVIYKSIYDYCLNCRFRTEAIRGAGNGHWLNDYNNLFVDPGDTCKEITLCGVKLPVFNDVTGFYEFCYSDKPLPTNITELLAELRMEMPKEKAEELEEIEKRITPTEKFFYWLARDKKANYFYIFDFVKIIPLLIFFAVMSAILFNGGWIITMIIGLYIIYGYIHKAASETYGKL